MVLTQVAIILLVLLSDLAAESFVTAESVSCDKKEDGLTNQTSESLVNTTIEWPAQPFFISAIYKVWIPIDTLEIEPAYGTVFTFDLTPLMNIPVQKFSFQTSNVDKKLVDEVPIAVRISIASYDVNEMMIYMELKCYKDDNVPFKGYLQKSIRIAVLTDQDRVFYKRVIPSSQVFSCQDVNNDRYDLYPVGSRSKLCEGSAFVNSTICIRISLVD